MTWQGLTTYSIAGSGDQGSASNICRRDYTIASGGGTISANIAAPGVANDVSVVIRCNADGTMDAAIVDPAGPDSDLTSVSGPLVINCVNDAL